MRAHKQVSRHEELLGQTPDSHDVILCSGLILCTTLILYMRFEESTFSKQIQLTSYVNLKLWRRVDMYNRPDT